MSEVMNSRVLKDRPLANAPPGALNIGKVRAEHPQPEARAIALSVHPIDLHHRKYCRRQPCRLLSFLPLRELHILQ